jgi:hypothetical protein
MDSTTYVQVRGNYSFVEKVAGISHDRINATLEIGYFFNPSWKRPHHWVRAMDGWRYQCAGAPNRPAIPGPVPVHDVLADEEFINVAAARPGSSTNG